MGQIDRQIAVRHSANERANGLFERPSFGKKIGSDTEEFCIGNQDHPCRLQARFADRFAIDGAFCRSGTIPVVE